MYQPQETSEEKSPALKVELRCDAMARITKQWPPSYRRSSSAPLLFLNRKSLSGEIIDDGNGRGVAVMVMGILSILMINLINMLKHQINGDLKHIVDLQDLFCFSHMRSYAAATWATMEAVHNLMLEVILILICKILMSQLFRMRSQRMRGRGWTQIIGKANLK